MENKVEFIKLVLAESEGEYISYVNPFHVVCITEGKSVKNPPHLGDFKTVIECTGNKYLNSNEDIKIVRKKIQGE